MVRIVILSAFASPFRSGAEACSEEVARALNGRFDITMVTSRLRRDLPGRDVLPGGVPLLRIGIGTSIDPWLFPLLAPFAARRLQPDIIHAVLESYAGLALAFCRFIVPKAKRLLTLQSTNTSFLLGPIHRSPHAITAISSVLSERAKRFGRSDVALIPNGVPLKGIEDACRAIQKQMPPHILFVGRLEPMKGIDTLLHAFALLPERMQDGTRLTIVGDGTLRSMLGVLAGELNISSRVTFTGYLTAEDLYKEFAGAAVFCGLSRSEALGNVFLEAQAAGCAVIATKVGGIPDIIKDGETGILVAPDDPKAAAVALEKVLTDKHLRDRLGEAGKAHAKDFDWAAIAERYADVYHHLL